ncbi:hypothetical protein ACOME3_006402 [Neoechinorhynchus agilis]
MLPDNSSFHISTNAHRNSSSIDNSVSFSRRQPPNSNRRKRYGTWTSILINTCSTIRDKSKYSFNSLLNSLSSLNLDRMTATDKVEDASKDIVGPSAPPPPPNVKGRSSSLQAVNSETDKTFTFDELLNKAQGILDDYIKSTDLTISNAASDRFIDDLDALVKVARGNRDSLTNRKSCQAERDMYIRRLKQMIDNNPIAALSENDFNESKNVNDGINDCGIEKTVLIEASAPPMFVGKGAQSAKSSTKELTLISPLLTNENHHAKMFNQQPIYCDRVYPQVNEIAIDSSQFIVRTFDNNNQAQANPIISQDLGAALTSFITPTVVVCLDRFTTSSYVVPDNLTEKFYVVFGMNQISTIKAYDISGNDLGEMSPGLDFSWEQNNAYRIHTIGQGISIQCKEDSKDNRDVIDERCMVVNEIKGYHLTDGYYALKQRLLFFDLETGSLKANTKRLTEVINPLESVHIDSDGQIYVFDTLTLMSMNKWAKKVDRVRSISVGTSFIACIFDRQVIICDKDGHQKFSWIVQRLSNNTTNAHGRYMSSIGSNVKPVCLKVYDDRIFVMCWLSDNYPANNILIEFDKEAPLQQPIHTHFQTPQIWNCWPDTFNCGVIGGANDFGSQFSSSQISVTPLDQNVHSGQIQSNQDSTWFHATWLTITNNRNAIISNIVPENPGAPSKKIIVVPIP